MRLPVLLRAERLWLARTVVVMGLVLGRYRSLVGGTAEAIPRAPGTTFRITIPEAAIAEADPATRADVG